MKRAAIAALATLGALATTVPDASASRLLTGYYEMSFPSGDTKNWVDNESWVGFSMEGRYFLKSNLSVGWSVGVHSLYEHVNGITELGRFDVSGDQYRNLNVFPILATGHAYLGEWEGTRPFVGMGAGVFANRQLLDVGAYTVNLTEWQFGFSPEVGVIVPLEWDSRLTIHARYHYPIEGGKYLDGRAHSFPFVSLGVGYGKGH
ncbi:MAG: hypothetical protein ACREOU_14785 [Candidatus Eiseniibacteriota bacterium]